MAKKQRSWDTWVPPIEMESKLPHTNRRALRDLIIHRTEPQTDYAVNFTVRWMQSDVREDRIRSGSEREQNVIVNAFNVLSVFQRMFPELNITYEKKSSDEQAKESG